MVQQILAGEVWTPDQHLLQQTIAIADGKIVDLKPISTEQPNSEPLDASDAIVIPGLVDLQVNGAMGWSFQASHRDHYDEIIDYHLKNGTTTLLPTLVTADESTLIDSLQSVADYNRSDTRATIPGIHLEGPFLAPEKSGAHDKDALTLPDIALAQRFFEAASDQLKITTLAPELPNASEVIAYFSERGVIVSAGHSAATYDEIQMAIQAGLSFVTHAGNASDWAHRAMGNLGFMTSEPGVVGTLMSESTLAGSIILDGYHFHPALVAPLLQLKGTDNLILVSDASTVAGCVAGEYDSGGLIVEVHPEGFATSGRGGGWLAGSIIPLLTAVQVAVNQAHIGLGDAVEMASLSPAKRLNIEDRKGQIRVSNDADMLILNQDLSLRHVIVGGHLLKG
jgi:N-acetylglucosamine-6-phosphate deacetylase